MVSPEERDAMKAQIVKDAMSGEGYSDQYIRGYLQSDDYQQHKSGRWSHGRADYVPFPEFEAEHRQQLERIYNLLLMGSNMERGAAYSELEGSPEAMKDFLMKCLPSSNIYPNIPEHYFPLGAPYLLQIQNAYMYKSELVSVHAALRAAVSKEQREKVVDDVVAKPYLLMEFLKRNIPQFSHL